MTISRCMGKKIYAAKCESCKRLPRAPEDEDTDLWVSPTEGRHPCKLYRGMAK